MVESGYYPPGAENDPNAPWNEKYNEPKPFNVLISQTLSKEVVVHSENYDEYTEKDEIGNYITEINTEDINWKEEYKSEHYTPLELIEEFKKFLELELKKGTNRNKAKYRELFRECEKWVEDELEVIKS